MFASELATGTVPTVRQIKNTLNMGQNRAQEISLYLAGLATKERLLRS